MRLFLASFANVDFYGDIKKDFKPYFDARWVEPKNLHLTWYFFGEQPSATPIIERLRELKMVPRLPLSMQGYGTFGNPYPKVFYLKTSTVVASVVHQKITQMLGVEPDEQFRAHVTLARIKRMHSNGYKSLERPWMSEPLGTIEAPIYLIESRLTPSGPIYIPLEEF